MWDTTNSYFSGQGVVLLAKRAPTTGLPMGFIPVGNVSDLKISVAVSNIEHKESRSGQRAIDLRLTTETKSSLSMTVENYLADALRGETVTIAGGSVTGEAVTVYLGKISSLKNLKVSAVVVKNGAATLVDGTDYEVNLEAGSLKFAPAITGLLDGGVVTVDYTFATQVKVDALTAPTSELYMRFEGLNTAEGNVPVVVEVFKFLTDPLKELALISDAIQQFTLEGSVLSDSLRATGSKFFQVQKLN